MEKTYTVTFDGLIPAGTGVLVSGEPTYRSHGCTVATEWHEEPEPHHQNILPDGSPAPGFQLEDEYSDFSAWTHSDSSTLTIAVDNPCADEYLGQRAEFDLTRKQALELAYWILATLK